MAVMLISWNLTLAAKTVQGPRRMELRDDRAEVGKPAACGEEGDKVNRLQRGSAVKVVLMFGDGRRIRRRAFASTFRRNCGMFRDQMSKPRRSLQSHGRNSRVYVPILREIFREKYTPDLSVIDFTLDDIRRWAGTLGIVTRNPADVIYRMRARTNLPIEILEAGFYILRAIGRGKYRLERAENTVLEIPDHTIIEALDLTPLPVRRLLPEELAKIDEQGLLTMISYCKLLDHFTGLQVFRLRSHVRKSVATIGQAELDEIDVGVALRDDEIPVIFPIEAKAADEPVNRVQISAMVMYCAEYFPGYEIRPLAIKLDYDSLIHFLEFNPSAEAAGLKIVKSCGYRLSLSERQKAMFTPKNQMVATKLAAETKE